MRMQRRFITLLSLCAAFILTGGSALASPIDVLITGTVTEDATGAVGIGTGLSVTLHFDSATPNEVAAPNYLATGNPGTLDSFLLIPVTGTIFDVTGTGSTSWDATGELNLTTVLPGTYFPLSITTTGIGMTPGQIAPDYSSLIGGEIVVDVQPVFPGFVKADVNSITIVPEPSTAALLGLGLAGLGAVRRRSA